ncbi:MAG: Clp protease ClpP [Blastocatellia bacterium]
MGIYTEYLNQQFDHARLEQERKTQLLRISKLRSDRDILVIAADLNKGQQPIAISYSDLLPFNDQLQSLSGTAIDVILETPGGSGEVAEDIVKQLRKKYDHVGIIVPGYAKSAGTIIAMAGDEILMEPASALGPIDAQLSWQGKVFSADALIAGMDKIKAEVVTTGALNKAYIPILQGISPGELQSAQNALDFAKILVTDWLVKYKFKDWATHRSTGLPVTADERKQRAEDIAKKLCDHGRWLTHGRSIKIDDLREMRLEITDYTESTELADAIRRYYTLLQMTFDSNVYKIFETPASQILKMAAPVVQTPTPDIKQADAINFDTACPKCKFTLHIQANFVKSLPLKPNYSPFPANNKISCPNCKTEVDLLAIRRDLESQVKKPII